MDGDTNEDENDGDEDDDENDDDDEEDEDEEEDDDDIADEVGDLRFRPVLRCAFWEVLAWFCVTLLLRVSLLWSCLFLDFWDFFWDFL